MRVLYLSQCGAPALYGSETSFLHLAQAAHEHDEIDLLTVVPPESGLATALQSRGIPHETCPLLAFEFTPLRRTYDFLRSVRGLRRIIAEYRPDIIHANELAANQIAIAATVGMDVPVVCHVRMIYRPRDLRWCLGPRASAVICVSGEACAVARDAGVEKRRVIPNPIEVPDLDCEELRETFRDQWGIPADAFVCAVVGRINRLKGQDVFLKAMEELAAAHDDAVGLIVGGGADTANSPWHEELRSLADRDQLREKIVWTGYLEDAWAAYCASDVVVMPSRSEGWGRTLPEAMATERAVVGSNTGGIPDIVADGENGLLVEVGDHEGLASSLIRLRNDRPLRERLARAGYAWVTENCAPQVHLRRVLDVYRSTIAAASGGSDHETPDDGAGASGGHDTA